MPAINESTDAAANTSTAYSIAPGDYFFGTLSTAAEADWVKVTLQAGQTYTFGLVGVGALNDNLDDAYLRLRDSGGGQIRFDDDDGPGLNSAITFTASTTGTYYLDVQSWNNTEAGDYGLSMVLGDRASYNVTMGAGALLRADASWAATSGTGATVTWGIRATGPAQDASGASAPFSVLSAAQAAAAQAAVAMYDGVSGLTLTQVNPGGTTDNATLLFGAYTSATDGAGAYAYYPGSTASTANAGDLWLNNDAVSTSSLPTGSYSFYAILHEMGHTMGLAHPGDYNTALGTSLAYANNAQFIEDSHQYSVMSYFDESNTTTTSVGGYPDTLLLYDIYALQRQYGADVTFNAGNTTYGFNATVGGAYDFTANTNPLLSIWDGGGTDTLDLSGYSMAQTISLKAGAFSSIGGYSGNLSIAIGAVIENAVGGAGKDIIIGNSAANQIDGGGGTDTLIGGGGTDTLTGGGGNDIFFVDHTADSVIETAGGGIDTVRASATFSLAANNEYLEQLIQSGSASIDGTGNGLNNLMIGNSGNNVLIGLRGNDVINANDGNDTLDGGAGLDTLRGGKGVDSISGGAGADLLLGGIGSDTLEGENGNDTLHGEGGSDTLYGDNGADSLDGGGGNDMLFGGLHNDMLFGGNHNDVLRGGDNDDTLTGGAGRDLLYGEGGADVFVFDSLSDSPITEAPDLIQDFVTGIDRIELAGLAASPLALEIGGEFTGGVPSAITLEFGTATRILIDLDGDQKVDMHITVVGALGLTGDDFIL